MTTSFMKGDETVEKEHTTDNLQDLIMDPYACSVDFGAQGILGVVMLPWFGTIGDGT